MEVDEVEHQIDPRTQRRAEQREGGEPDPAGGTGTGGIALIGTGRGSDDVRPAAQRRVQLLDVVGVGALLRPVDRGGARGPGQRVVHVAGHHDLGLGQPGVHPGQVEPVEVGQRAATVGDLRAVGVEQPARRER